MGRPILHLTRRVGIAFVALILTLDPSTSQVAKAHDHAEPAARLRVGQSEAQDGIVIWSSWTRRRQGSCVTFHGDGWEHYPEPGLVAPAGEITGRVALRKRHKPNKVKIWAWQEVDENGWAIGKGERLEVELRRRNAPNRKPWWVARFTTDLVEDLYLQVYGKWRDREKCGISQDVLWSFHIEAEPLLPPGP